MSSPISIRLHESTIERLTTRAKRSQMAPRTLAQRYVEEGLRMDEHPLIRFEDGPSGRDATVVGRGTAVWQIISAIRGNNNDVEDTAEHLQFPLGLMEAAVTYYGAYPDEIDEAIADNDRQFEEGYTAWQAGLAALARK